MWKIKVNIQIIPVWLFLAAAEAIAVQHEN
jgi:hypothetical protein